MILKKVWKNKCELSFNLIDADGGNRITQYKKFLNNFYFEHPVINVNGIINSFGENKELEDAETEEKMNMYREIQYYNLHDNKEIDKALFE